MGQFDIAVVAIRAKSPYSQASVKQYPNGLVLRSYFALLIPAVPVAAFFAVSRGVLTRAKARSQGESVFAGLKPRAPGLKSGATPD
jgi:hypothetical protein